jgi:hypothetical protein
MFELLVFPAHPLTLITFNWLVCWLLSGIWFGASNMFYAIAHVVRHWLPTTELQSWMTSCLICGGYSWFFSEFLKFLPSNHTHYFVLDSTVGAGTDYELDDRVWVLVGSTIFTSPCYLDRLWGPPCLLYSGYLGINQPGHEADHSPSTNAEVKKMWIFTSTTHSSSWHNV